MTIKNAVLLWYIRYPIKYSLIYVTSIKIKKLHDK
jgi:hypothetical protein